MRTNVRCPVMILCLMVLLTSCSQQATAPGGQVAEPVATTPGEASEPGTTLTVFAAASLTDAFGEIGRLFEEEYPGATVTFNFAGSNQLAAQIGEGAPADVFASANRRQMDAAVESGRIDASGVEIFVTNRLVVVYPSENPAGLSSLQDLAQPGLLLVLAAEGVPVGQYSLEFLHKASLDPQFGSPFREAVLSNVVSYEENVRSVLNKVELGEVDAGIVYTSDAAGAEGLGRIEIPGPLNGIAEYPIAALNDSPNSDLAAAFVAWVLGDDGQAILAEYGFGSPDMP